MAQADYVTNAIRALSTGARPEPSTNPVGVACTVTAANLAGHHTPFFRLRPHAVDPEDGADRLGKVLTALSASLNAIVDDSERVVPGGLSFRPIYTLLSGLDSDLQPVAEGAAWGGA
jgi:hypothetical protein